MTIPARVLIVEALIAAAVAAALTRPGKAQFIVPGQARYQTGCEAAGPATVTGFVKNPGTGIIRIEGTVRFTFTVANALSRPAVEMRVDAAVPPGQTAAVAQAKLFPELKPDEVCFFDPGPAVR